MVSVRILTGDCREVLPTLEADSVHAVVTDPPYGLAFMGKHWDHGVPGEPFWTEVLRVAKPGAHLLAFGGTRTFHRLTCAIEDAGWEIRDTIMWVYGSGFPKSLDVSKAIDKAAGAEREVVGERNYAYPDTDRPGIAAPGGERAGAFGQPFLGVGRKVTAPATEAARQWSGWGTALKPAWEPVIVARKPLAGTVAENVQEHGTGALNVDGCRVEAGDETIGDGSKNLASWRRAEGRADLPERPPAAREPGLGRWPANLIHDGSEEVVRLFPEQESGGFPLARVPREESPANVLKRAKGNESVQGMGATSGSAARFFYCAKADRSDRTEGGQVENRHPTVKPTDLMRYLCRLVTPPGGTVLDPFMGSGSTGKAALMEGFEFIGIEKDPESVEVAEKRLTLGDAAQAVMPI